MREERGAEGCVVCLGSGEEGGGGKGRGDGDGVWGEGEVGRKFERGWTDLAGFVLCDFVLGVFLAIFTLSVTLRCQHIPPRSVVLGSW